MDTNATLNLELDLLTVESIAADLKSYLLSDILYWPLSARRPAGVSLPKGTLGGYLLRVHRLTALEHLLTPSQLARLDQAMALAEQQLDEWAVQAEQKGLFEMKARLRGWLAYLEECLDDPARHAADYALQAEARTIMELLLDFLGSAAEDEHYPARLAAADQQLRDLTRQSGFVWHESMRPAFPPERFWWLYVRPKLPAD